MLPRACRLVLACSGLLALGVAPADAREGSRLPVAAEGRTGVVATESPAASRVARDVLAQGGNAIDAAAAAVFAISVARPQSCGIGGGGFLVYRSASGATRTLDFREAAPAAYTPQTLDPPGLHKTFTGHLPVGVPGTVAGMDAALQRYGTRSLAATIAPAERLARRGFRIPTSLVGAMRQNAARLRLFPAAAAQFLKDGQPYAPGETLVQPELAASLRRLMRGGPAALYGGAIGRRIVADMRAARPTNDPGLLTLADLEAYSARWLAPVTGTYRGRDVVTMGPPTSGGVAIVEMLNLLERFDLRKAGQSSADAIHLVAEAQRIAWADRNAYLADPAFVPQPTAFLTSKAYADARAGEIQLERTTAHAPGRLPAAAGARASGEETNPNGSTTQVSVVDARGAAVSLTCTNEQEFGSAVVAPGTGILLNNELTDFSAAGTANEPRAGKRPRSSMSPTILVEDGRPILLTGGAGGSRIIMGALETIINRVDFGLTLAQAVDAERFDSQGTSTLEIEDARVDPAALASLQARGWTLSRLGEYGVRPRIQLAGIEPRTGRTAGVSDARSDRAALVPRAVARR
ncbi:MAG: Gamma-glutamyltranspeptidase [Solirubrobacterales bacterium]|nr:Gamma-glutamyltranspeptidase [Solirubrobacterales bacterium]